MQIQRLFEIVYILLEKKNVTAKELAEHFEVSARTIYRDVETLSEAGIPIYANKGKGGGIRLMPEFVLNKAVITQQERTDILASLSAMGAVDFSNRNTAFGKLASLFGGPQADWIEVDFGLWSDGEKEARLFQTAKQCILQKQVIRFLYNSGNGETLIREVEPLKLIFKGTAWYLYGFCRIREDFRLFKLRRMESLVVMDERFLRKIPKKVLVPDKEEPEKTEMMKVRIRIEKEAAYRAYDDFEHCSLQEDGSVIADAYFQKTDWLINYLLSFGDSCQVLEPVELREEIKEKLYDMLEKYQ